MIPHTIFRKNREAGNKAIIQLLIRLKEVGLAKIYFGIESGCNSQLKRYRRGYPLNDLETTINIIRDELNIDIDAGFIMFDPFLGLDEMLENIHFFRRNDLIKSNQWPFRPMIVNAGSHMYESLLNSDLITSENINYMSYDYKFLNNSIQNIHLIIDKLSAESRSIFYALKIISKRQFAPDKKDQGSLKAQDYIERNGLIYLDLMEDLVYAYQKESLDSIYQFIRIARFEIDKLIDFVERDIYNGILPDNSGFISGKIKLYKAHRTEYLKENLFQPQNVPPVETK